MGLSKRISYVSDFVQISHTTFECLSNTSLMGGAIFSDKTLEFSVAFCHFFDCTSSCGGAIYITNSRLNSFFTCFRECQAPHTYDGGNAIRFDSSVLDFKYLSTFKCARDSEVKGDGTIFGLNSQCFMSLLNFSHSLGIMGESSIGIYNSVGISRVSNMNIVNSSDHNVLNMGPGYCDNSNIISNNPTYFLISGAFGAYQMNSCAFYYNLRTNFEHSYNITLNNCKGDFSFTGLITTNFFTIRHTYIGCEYFHKRSNRVDNNILSLLVHFCCCSILEHVFIAKN